MTILTWLYSWLLEIPSNPGGSEESPLELWAVPGLTTLLDTALQEAVEGELTATLTSGHKLLLAWLDLKQQAILVLHCLKESALANKSSPYRRSPVESLARSCLEAASDALDQISTDKLASTANIVDPYESVNSASSSAGGSHHHNPHHHHHHHHHHSSLSGISVQSLPQSLEESSRDTARRWAPHAALRGRDCWETPRLHCVDYVWADDVASHCQRLLRGLWRQAGSVESDLSLQLQQHTEHSTFGFDVERHLAVLSHLIQTDLPSRLIQFRSSYEADSCVLKRLYLVKCEYRAPFRGFLEAHQSVLKAPSLGLVDESMALATASVGSRGGAAAGSKASKHRNAARDRLTALLEDETVLEALALEKAAADLEADLAKALFPFAELARFLDHKRARLRAVPRLAETPEDLADLHETLRRLRAVLCRKAGPETSQGIRPLLLDLQGVPRDEEVASPSPADSSSSSPPTPTVDEESMLIRLDNLVIELETLARMAEQRVGFCSDRPVSQKSGGGGGGSGSGHGTDVDLPAAISRGCAQFDGELFSCQYRDWYDLVVRQHQVVKGKDMDAFADELRRAEMQVSLSVAPAASLQVVRDRVSAVLEDRDKRFEVLKEALEDVCLRELSLHVSVRAPGEAQPLVLQPTSALGVFGLPLQMSGAVLPLG
jgi:hypothetical protein